MTNKSKVFTNKFAPQEGLINKYEKPIRDELCLNGYWQFMPLNLPSELSLDIIPNEILPIYNWEETLIKVPSPWNVNSFTNGEGGDFRSYPSYPETWDKANCGWLKKEIMIPNDWSNNRIILHFEAIAGHTKIFVNGKSVIENDDSFLPFNVDVTEYVKPGENTTILVWVANQQVFEKQANYGRREHIAGSFWGSHISGIWQDVYLQKVPEIGVKDVFIKPNLKKDILEIEVLINNGSNCNVNISLNSQIFKWLNKVNDTLLDRPNIDFELSEELLTSDDEFELDSNKITKVNIVIPVNKKLALWSHNEPNLHSLMLNIYVEGKLIDIKYERFGYRSFEIKKNQLYLNDEKIQIKGDSWHFMGVPQMTRRYAYAWYKMLKDANANGVRLHAQVYPRFYLDMADEMGICVLDETAIWWSDHRTNMESELYWSRAKKHVSGMIKRDKNNPSVFGWSVCNETLEVAQMVHHAPKHLVRRNVQEINKWVDITSKTDPTRTWISGDGELFPFTNLPTRIYHYVDPIHLKMLSILRKPWGVGETGMAYFGTPAQISKFNGDRAFESQQGRMEGIAAEAFEQIKLQRNLKATYVSIFNVVWYGLKPLPFGLSDDSKAPTLKDGIFFTDYIEGLPGYQPERIGPYSSTLNPGYDGSIELYQPWPLFDAVKAGYSDNYKSFENKWHKKKDTTVKKPKHKTIQSVVWLSEKEESINRSKFEKLGIKFEKLNNNKQLIIIDGVNPPIKNDVIRKLKNSLNTGSNVLVWQTTKDAKKIIESLLDKDIQIFERDATSYLVSKPHPIINNQSHKSLYFSEVAEKAVSNYTLGGDFSNSDVILTACDTDWRKWNYQGEAIKTAMVYRSEKEFKHPSPVIVKQDVGNGELILSTLDIFSIPMVGVDITLKMLNNLGISIKKTSLNNKAIGLNYKLKNAQLIECHKGSNKIISEKIVSSNIFGTIKIDALKTKSDYYLKFSIFSPRSLTDLLIEPGTPKLDMSINGLISDVLVNESIVKKDINSNKVKVSGLPLEKGWNDLLIKLENDTKLQLKFSCSKKSFLKVMDSIIEK